MAFLITPCALLFCLASKGQTLPEPTRSLAAGAGDGAGLPSPVALRQLWWHGASRGQGWVTPTQTGPEISLTRRVHQTGPVLFFPWGHWKVSRWFQGAGCDPGWRTARSRGPGSRGWAKLRAWKPPQDARAWHAVNSAGSSRVLCDWKRMLLGFNN